jgi:TetR/AcrR family transcriptional regulator
VAYITVSQERISSRDANPGKGLRVTAPSPLPSGGPTRRRRLAGEKRKQQIAAAARGVFTQHGLAAARTADIAMAAGVNEALVYRHFRSKDELFEAAVVAPLRETMDRLAQIAGSPIQDFDETGEIAYGLTLQHVGNLLRTMDNIGPLLGVVMFGNAGTGASYYRERIAPVLAENERLITLNLPYWRHRDFDPQQAAEAVFGAAWFRATAARLTGQAIDHEAEAALLVSMLFDGLRRPRQPLPGQERPNRRQPRGAARERREQILEAARAVFVRYGLAGARTRDIADEAGIHEAQVFRHFRSKEELFEAAVAVPLAETAAWLAQASGVPIEDFADIGGIAYGRARQHMHNLLRAMEQIAPLLGVLLFGSAETAASHYRERIAPFLDETERIVAVNLPHRPDRDTGIELAVQFLFGACWFRATAAQLTGRRIDYDTEAGTLTALLLDGLRPHPPVGGKGRVPG